jgi:hypothetical protein
VFILPAILLTFSLELGAQLLKLVDGASSQYEFGTLKISCRRFLNKNVPVDRKQMPTHGPIHCWH